MYASALAIEVCCKLSATTNSKWLDNGYMLHLFDSNMLGTVAKWNRVVRWENVTSS